MKKVMISLFALLLLAAQAQGAKEPLAVLVVGVDNWMFGDVIAHIVGEELKRGNPNLVPVTREKFVQNKLKALRRASGDLNRCELRDWANNQKLSQVCLVEAKADGATAFSFNSAKQSYSALRIHVADNRMSCSANFTFSRGATGEMGSAELTKVAWEVVGRLQSNGCKISDVRCFDFEPEMVLVEGGTFEIGCKADRDCWGSKCCLDARPGNRTSSVTVTLSDFQMGKYEVTQSEWVTVMRATSFRSWAESKGYSNFSSGFGDRHPVYGVNYADIVQFLDSLNVRTGRKGSGHEYRLPTEAEWEYAARGGKKMYDAAFCSIGCRYSGSGTAWHVAWSEENSGEKAHEVGTRKTQTKNGTPSPVDGGNQLGIHDMSGNVSEWCKDWYSSDYLPPNNSSNPTGPVSGSTRVFRGGHWEVGACMLAACRNFGIPPSNRDFFLGFRVVLP
ncbi:MAG: formylglycine-generating enzyme family protein [Prevotellaceae bacterium]|nr:formylglycine-generating enzyme family protein [Prevotellaceae bacterium]